MSRLEKVIRCLEQCVEKNIDCGFEKGDNEKCPYSDEDACVTTMLRDALGELREYGRITAGEKPKIEGAGATWWNVCGFCKTAINPNDKFCHECGTAVKWNE